MKQFLPILKSTKLFQGIHNNELEELIGCLGAKAVDYKKNEYVYNSGDYINTIAILVKGSLMIQKDDFWGNRSIVNRISVGEVFGEAYAIEENQVMLNDVVALEDSTVVMLNFRKIINICPKACRFHTLIIENLIHSMSCKNRLLTQKIDYMSQRTTREKLMAYLSAQSKKENSPSFDIPFNRQQLADYLCVDRSAMSNELSKMADEGLIKYNRSHFELI